MRKRSNRPKKIYSERELQSRILNLIKLANKRGDITIKLGDGTLMSLVGIRQYRRLIAERDALINSHWASYNQ